MVDIIETKIIRSRRKTVALSVTPDATLIVKAPLFTPKFFINSFIKQHEEWIKKQIQVVQERKQLEKDYRNGEIFLFLGLERQLDIGNYPEVALQDNKIVFPQALLFRAKKQLIAWYKKQAKIIITQQVEQYAKQMKTSYGSITFSDTRSQWGSCTHENNLQFSWRLIMAPILVINYVVVHELAHTFEKNHSREFWHIVNAYCPSYKRQRKWLSEHGKELVI